MLEQLGVPKRDQVSESEDTVEVTLTTEPAVQHVGTLQEVKEKLDSDPKSQVVPEESKELEE
jgi:hypothetical protein